MKLSSSPFSIYPQIERFAFLVGYDQRRYGTVTEQEANIKAAKLKGRLFEQVADAGYDERETSVLLIRLLFIMFADDTGLWRKDLFAEFIATSPVFPAWGTHALSAV